MMKSMWLKQNNQAYLVPVHLMKRNPLLSHKKPHIPLSEYSHLSKEEEGLVMNLRFSSKKILLLREQRGHLVRFIKSDDPDMLISLVFLNRHIFRTIDIPYPVNLEKLMGDIDKILINDVDRCLGAFLCQHLIGFFVPKGRGTPNGYE